MCNTREENAAELAREEAIPTVNPEPTVEAINEELLSALKRVYEYEQERRQKDDHHFHEEEIDSWGELIAKAEGR